MEKESVVHYKRLVLEITKDLHANIKSRAAVRNITMRKWVMMAIVEQIKRETAVY
jgi:predicted HicB family RNase H-like nuclease